MDNGEQQDFTQQEFAALDMQESVEKLKEGTIEVPDDFRPDDE
jgi:hypothetical protein